MAVPNTPPTPQTAMYPAPSPYSPWGQNPLQVQPPSPGTGGQGGGGSWTTFQNMPPQTNVYGGQQIAGSTPSMGQYGQVQQYADQAHQQARRYLDPQQATQNRRLQQEMINKGVDPNSAAGRQMQDQVAREQAEANQAAAFGALGFGQGIQRQMSQQELANQQIAAAMEQARWQAGLGARGQDINRELGLGGLEQQRYGTDVQRELGLGQLDLGRQQQEFAEMTGLEGIDFRNRQYADQLGQYQDQLTMALMGMTPVPGMTPLDPSGAFGTTIGSAGQNQGFLGRLIGF